MNATRILAAMFVALSAVGASAGPFESPIERANRESSERMWSGARDQLSAQISEFNQQMAEARARFWETYPDKPGSAEAQQRFSELLRDKDQYYLAVGLGGRLVNAGVDDPLDGGIRRSASPEFEDLVKAAADRFRAGDMLQLGRQLFTAIDCCPALYKAYVIERDWWEFDRVQRIPAGCDKTDTYGACLYRRWGKVPGEEAGAIYEAMVELLGKQLVYDAAKKVMAAPKTESGLLVVTARRPVKIGPGGSEVDDDSVPMPETVIGTYSNPLVAMEILATQGDDRRYLLSLLKSLYDRERRLGAPNKWAFAVMRYDRLKLAFGEKDVLEVARAVRTAKKQMTDGRVMDPKAIGSTRTEPFSAFEDVLSRKNPVGHVRNALMFHENLKTPAEVDAAYKKLVATSDEKKVLDAARQLAAGGSNLPFEPNLRQPGEFEMLKQVLDGSLTFAKPPAPETLVDFPDYLAWKKLKPGAKISYATRYWKQDQLSYQMPVRSNRLIPEMQHHQAYQLQTINDEQAKLWFTQSSYDKFGRPKPADDKEIYYPARYAGPAKPPPDLLAPTSNAAWGAKRTSGAVQSGDETVEVNGKRIATRWQSASYSYDDGCSLVVKVWTSDDVPTGLIRRVEDKSCAPSPGKPYGVRFVSETFLESFGGFTPATPDSSKPVAAAYAPIPATPTPVATAPAPAAQPQPSPAPAPVSAQPAPAPPRRTPPPPPARMPTPAGLPPEAAAQFELAQRYNVAMVRANNAKRELAQQSAELPANVRAARDRLDDQLKAVLTAMTNRDNAQAAQNLQSYEDTVAVIEKYLGQ